MVKKNWIILFESNKNIKKEKLKRISHNEESNLIIPLSVKGLEGTKR